MSNSEPLVSIIVITYNSSKYVLETLESAKVQTYNNIELVISDDCSTDNTVEICKNWLKQNQDYFVRTKLISVKENTGIPKNCNRGLYESQGEWVKLIAGDDALMPDCIKDNIEFVNTAQDIFFCFSNFDYYNNNFEANNIIIKNLEIDDRSRKFSELNPEFQLKVLVRKAIIHGPVTFINRQKLIEIGGYDETYPFMEDRTTWYNWSIAGNKFYYLPKKTVKYRVHSNSISNKTRAHTNNTKTDIKIINIGDVIYERFYKYFTIREKIYYHITFSYLHFFKQKNKLNFLMKIFRKCWSFLVKRADNYFFNSLDKIYKEYCKGAYKG